MSPKLTNSEIPEEWATSINNIGQSLIQASGIQESFGEMFLQQATVLSDALNMGLTSLMSSLAEAFELTPLLDLQRHLRELAEQFKITEEEAVTILKKYKWIIGPSLSIDLVYTVIQVGRQNGNQRHAINQIFVEYMISNKCQNLSAIVGNWKSNPLYKPRMKIFKDCVKALQMNSQSFNPSNLVVPTLIAQIDAILSVYMRTHGISRSDTQWRQKIKELTGNDLSSELANDLLLHILFQKSRTGQPLENPTTFNRHKILHGENMRYGRIDNALRAFLLLDFLAEF